EAEVNGLHIYLLGQPELFSDPCIYPEKLDAVTVLPFIFLSFAPFELLRLTGWKPQFLHAHDWTTAPVSAALKWHRYYSYFNGDYDTVFTIHNLAFQGIISPSVLEGWGFSPRAFSNLDTDSLEYFGQVNMMKGAITTTEAFTTVSPNYSWDIQTPNGGLGLDGVIVAHKNKLRGIINGIDYDIWNPKTDSLLPANYSIGDMGGKEECRRALLKECGWKEDRRPILIFVGRLTEQKGIDIMLDGVRPFLAKKARFVIVGSGNDLYTRKVFEFRKEYPHSVHEILEFNEAKAHLAYAGGDMLLMPSLFEPCGLSQLIAFAYGTIPVARATGGLADTVIDADGSPDGTGFLFKDFSHEELQKAIDRALAAKDDGTRWDGIIRNAMGSDFSWDNSAKAYAELYRDILTSD
ncbi:MAG TPA: glycogen synthase, partial [Synergistaceae bacterium]|nr:glycogen synthase [Synergistaceae bacterium]